MAERYYMETMIKRVLFIFDLIDSRNVSYELQALRDIEEYTAICLEYKTNYSPRFFKEMSHFWKLFNELEDEIYQLFSEVEL